MIRIRRPGTAAPEPRHTGKFTQRDLKHHGTQWQKAIHVERDESLFERRPAGIAASRHLMLFRLLRAHDHGDPSQGLIVGESRPVHSFTGGNDTCGRKHRY